MIRSRQNRSLMYTIRILENHKFMEKKEIWIDYMKVLACGLVLVGHLFQGLLRSEILPQRFELNYVLWAIYLFHVQIFFLCSGYLYQRGMHVTSAAAWAKNVRNKAVALGIPYFFFATVTWLLKAVSGPSANTDSGTLVSFLFVSPATAPYWYLYTLFFLFLLLPNIRNQKVLIGILAVFFVLYMLSWYLTFSFLLMSIAEYGFWFVLGMTMQSVTQSTPVSNSKTLFCGGIFLLLFAAGSFFLYSKGYNGTFNAWTLLLGTLACMGFTFVFQYISKGGYESPAVQFLSKYTLPVYLMHTIFAAGMRSLLLRAGITSPALHLIVGFAAAFLLPLAVAVFMEKTFYPNILIYPWKVIRRKK